jgi:tRNA-dihydrouridine synthase 2
MVYRGIPLFDFYLFFFPIVLLKTVDFIDSEGKLVFQTNEQERGRVVFQLGTADPESALKAAKIV